MLMEEQMAVSGIPRGSGNPPVPPPAAGRRIHDGTPGEDPVVASTPPGCNGDPDDTGYSTDPAGHRRVDVTA
jgi:hypothetical protein